MTRPDAGGRRGTSRPILSIRDLHVHFFTESGRRAVVNGLSMDLQYGEMLGLVGEAGSGKSVVGLACLGLVRPPGEIMGGTIIYQGRDLLSLSSRDLRRIRGSHIALVPPNARAALHPMMRVGHQIAGVYRTHAGVGKAEARDKTLYMLDAVGIPDPTRRFHAYPHELSGGMAQRVAIAAALICSPKVLIADEPTTGLDVTIQAQILALMNSLIRETGTAALMLTRDLGIVAHYCQRVGVLYAGQLVETSDTNAFFAKSAHPYSQSLLNSIFSRRRGNTVKMLGAPPTFSELPTGCVCKARCPWATDICQTEAPTWRTMGPGQEVRCHWARRTAPVDKGNVET